MRVFIAVNLPDEVKEELLRYRYDVPAKWAKKENIHITLNFLGYVSDERLESILKAAEDVSRKHSPFYVRINKICYGPKGKMPPRMIWAVGESPELSKLKQDLDKALNSLEDRKFSCHITLARIKALEFKRMEPEDIPQVSEDLDLSFKVDSVEVMESVLKRQGPEYTILQSYKL